MNLALHDGVVEVRLQTLSGHVLEGHGPLRAEADQVEKRGRARAVGADAKELFRALLELLLVACSLLGRDRRQRVADELREQPLKFIFGFQAHGVT